MFHGYAGAREDYLMKKLHVGLSAACVALGWAVATAAPPDAKTLGKNLAKAVASQKADNVSAALTALLKAGGKESLDPILKQIGMTSSKGSQAIYWQLINGASGFRDRPALVALGEFIVKAGKKKAPFARDILFGLENNNSPNTIEVLKRVVREKKCYDLQLMAADQLAQVHTTTSVDVLIEALKKEGNKGDPEFRRRLMSALQTITKENLGGDPRNWIDWWSVNKSKGLPKVLEDTERGGGQYASSTMNRDRKKQFESLKKRKGRILVITSRLPKDHPKEPNRDYNKDHMEQVLAGMKIPHEVVLKANFEKDPWKYLKKAWTVLINCNSILPQCICKTCRKLLSEKMAKGQAGPKKNRLFGCPPECSQHDQVNYRLKKPAVMALKKWVEKGGYLFTEDWGIIEVIEVAWPNLVTSDSKDEPGPGGTTKKQAKLIKQTTVPILPGKGMTSRPLLRGVFTRPRPPAREKKKDDDDAGGTYVPRRDGSESNPTRPPSHKWVIDDESPTILVKSRKVSVLMVSEELGKLAGGTPPNDAVAVSFRVGKGKRKGKKRRKRKITGGSSSGGKLVGKSRGRGEWGESLRGGRVLHVMSHFGKQQSSSQDTFVLQNLILNFIMESNRQHSR